MKLTTILTNNWETLKGASVNNNFVDKLDWLVNQAVADSTEVLLYATELNEQDVKSLDKNLSGWSSHIVSKNNRDDDYRVAFASNEIVEFDDSQVLVPFWGKLNWVVAISENWENSYVGSLMHQHPYAWWKKGLYWILADWSPDRFEDIEQWVIATRYNKKALEQKGLFSKEFHTWYYDMYWSIAFNLLFWQWDWWLVPQKEFVEKMTELGLHPVWDLGSYTYETHKLKFPIRFRGIHTFITEDLVWKNKETLEKASFVDIHSPEWRNDRATIISKFEW